MSGQQPTDDYRSVPVQVPHAPRYLTPMPRFDRDKLAGTGFILLAASCFGLMPLFSAFAWQDGLRPTDLLTLRFGLAAAILWAIVRVRGLPLPRGRALWLLAGMGALGYAGVALCYFTALTMAPAVVVALLLYLYPAFVTAFAWLLLRERATPRRLFALGCALLGCALTIGYAHGAQPAGVALGALAGLMYALYTLAGRRLPASVPALSQAAVVCSAACLAMAALSLPTGLVLPHSAAAWAGVLAIALLSTVLGVSSFLAGLRRLGATRSAMLSTFEPVVTAVAGIALLGQPIGLGTLAGGVLILSAGVLVLRD
ncbi:DMT family transporter [Niveibacterium sp. 24ML]|uniref:DMT family transporter n=1 Tax=Niveibacterium sp. 24ML TaxID=2985512 RepID=UPI00226E2557|nr:DMT family transporter [Niveibacterium sp. 24ML]MCX9155980.1 DMT family transporter [Niveibacterium sp. 24ML]